MKKSVNSLDVIVPRIATPGVKALFTLKNPAFEQERAVIEGLNLGAGTVDPEPVIHANRGYLLDRLGLEKDWVAYGEQVHSNRVRLVTQGGVYPETDGLISAVPGLALAIQVADCAAVLMWDPDAGIIAAIHAGWRGAVSEIVPAGLHAMREQGAVLSNTRAFISPCISFANFEVGEEVAVQFPEAFVDYQSYAKPHVDLKGFIESQLEQEGLRASHIECHQGCTIEDGENFYSYRREKEKSGRMLGIVWID